MLNISDSMLSYLVLMQTIWCIRCSILTGLQGVISQPQPPSQYRVMGPEINQVYGICVLLEPHRGTLFLCDFLTPDADRVCC